MGVSGQHHAPAALYPWGKDPGTHWRGGWVGPRAGLDTEDRGKILCPCRGSNPDRPVVEPVVRHYTAWANPAPILLNYTLSIVNTRLTDAFCTSNVQLFNIVSVYDEKWLDTRYDIHNAHMFNAVRQPTYRCEQPQATINEELQSKNYGTSYSWTLGKDTCE
jgi:hypothetical protein